MGVSELISALEELPGPQRRVLFPLIAWSVVQNAPASVAIPDPLVRRLEDFIESLGPDESEWPRVVDERLQEAGVTVALLREIRARVSTASVRPDAKQLLALENHPLEPRRGPRGTEVKSGPSLRFELMAGMMHRRED